MILVNTIRLCYFLNVLNLSNLIKRRITSQTTIIIEIAVFLVCNNTKPSIAALIFPRLNNKYEVDIKELKATYVRNDLQRDKNTEREYNFSIHLINRGQSSESLKVLLAESLTI